MMATYWTVRRARHVVAYLISLREAGEDLRLAINSLHLGPPEDAHKLQDDPETWEWLEARHWITFVVADRNQKWLYVTDVESVTVE
ncbi:MAG: hypothetical protein U0350_03585 [Caldilineaceae bacterium]